MANLNAVLNDRIARVARKEIRKQTGTVRNATARYRRDIAALKRQVADLVKRLVLAESRLPKASMEIPSELPQNVRYSARSVRAQRARLGLSARDFGKLVGVSGLTVYGWESGKQRPRRKQMAGLVAVRNIGRREAVRRLAELGGGAVRGRRKTYSQTAQEFIASLVKSGKAATSRQINVAWKAAGRPGKADNTLSRMVTARRLARTKLKGERGSRYAAR
jgi:DNA-binding transcriptional regulator YiaG